MCFGSRKKEEADAMRSKDLDKMIKADEKRMAKEVKLLLLGTTRPIAATAVRRLTLACKQAR